MNAQKECDGQTDRLKT